jgi:hypothetical protein
MSNKKIIGVVSGNERLYRYWVQEHGLLSSYYVRVHNMEGIRGREFSEVVNGYGHDLVSEDVKKAAKNRIR